MSEISTYNFTVYISITPQNKWKYQLTFISELHSKCWSENIHQVPLPLTHCWASLLMTAQPHLWSLLSPRVGVGVSQKNHRGDGPCPRWCTLFSPRECPLPCAHVVISLMATGGTSYAPSAGEGQEVGTGRVRCWFFPCILLDYI